MDDALVKYQETAKMIEQCKKELEEAAKEREKYSKPLVAKEKVFYLVVT